MHTDSIVRWRLHKLVAGILFVYWCHLALQCATGGDATMLAAVTVMIVLIETKGK